MAPEPPPLAGATSGASTCGCPARYPPRSATKRERGRTRASAWLFVCYPRPPKAARAVAPGARLYADWRKLLARETEIDFIDVATPPHAHAAIALAALERGVHVLCEKPLTTTVAEARTLVDAARAHRRVVFPAHNYKHAPVVKFAQQIIQ